MWEKKRPLYLEKKKKKRGGTLVRGGGGGKKKKFPKGKGRGVTASHRGGGFGKTLTGRNWGGKKGKKRANPKKRP